MEEEAAKEEEKEEDGEGAEKEGEEDKEKKEGEEKTKGPFDYDYPPVPFYKQEPLVPELGIFWRSRGPFTSSLACLSTPSRALSRRGGGGGAGEAAVGADERGAGGPLCERLPLPRRPPRPQHRLPLGQQGALHAPRQRPLPPHPHLLQAQGRHAGSHSLHSSFGEGTEVVVGRW